MRVEIILLCEKKEPLERHETSRAVYKIGYISLIQYSKEPHSAVQAIYLNFS